MNATNTDLSLILNEFREEEREAAKDHIASMIKKDHAFPEWIKNPPDWWVAMYLIDPDQSAKANHLAFEAIECREGWYKAVHPLMFTHMLIIGQIDDQVGYTDRWCYKDFNSALKAMQEWDGKEGTEPEGWHRHPTTGRRREQKEDGTWFQLAQVY